MNKTNHIAFVFDDLTEFFTIRPAIDELIKQKLSVDIIVPFDSGYNGLAEHTINTIKKLGYSPKKDAPKEKSYKILLTPYPGLDVVKRTKYVYHLRYPYGALCAKPNPAYLPECRIDYDGIFSFNAYDQTYLSAYGATIYPLPYWKYYDFKKHNPSSDKPNLLILPTFGSDTSCIDELSQDIIESIKKHFHIIIKTHHAVHFRANGDSTFEKLQSFADEFYTSDVPINELLQKADLVLSDNSGAIFESICAGVPVALYCKDLNVRHLNSINTPQFNFVQQKLIPHTNQPNKILPMLLSIDKYKEKQKSLKRQLFLPIPKNPYAPFVATIKTYLETDENNDYRKTLHDLLVKEWKNDKTTISNQEKTIAQLNQNLLNLQNSTSWRITKPLRKAMALLRGEKNA